MNEPIPVSVSWCDSSLKNFSVSKWEFERWQKVWCQFYVKKELLKINVISLHGNADKIFSSRHLFSETATIHSFPDSLKNPIQKFKVQPISPSSLPVHPLLLFSQKRKFWLDPLKFRNDCFQCNSICLFSCLL